LAAAANAESVMHLNEQNCSSGADSSDDTLSALWHSPLTKRRVGLVRCFFHIVGDNERYDDEVGQHWPGIEAASARAAVVAGELAQDTGWSGFSILVIDEHGNEIVRRRIDQ
jgi:hypothetical protein